MSMSIKINEGESVGKACFANFNGSANLGGEVTD